MAAALGEANYFGPDTCSARPSWLLSGPQSREHSNYALLDADLIDFEQQGGWPARAPPEVYYVDYVEQISLSLRLPSRIKDKYSALLQKAFPQMPPRDRNKTYDGTTRGSTLSWLSLSDEQQEAAMVYMLGKLIWCIFEEQTETICGLGVDLVEEADPSIRFPAFRLTPLEMRDCIRKCIAGAPEWQGTRTPLARRRDEWCILGANNDVTKNADISSIQEMAKTWWKVELDAAEAYVQSIASGGERVDTCWRQRPTLQEVLKILDIRMK